MDEAENVSPEVEATPEVAEVSSEDVAVEEVQAD